MGSVDYFSIIASVLGGLAFFLYGMTLLGNGLEKVSGGRLERTLEKMSNNIFKAVLFGALVTAAVQSSSATTVIVVGLVNANIIKLKQAIGVIMGANIGTTITAHILSMMDIQSDSFLINLLKPTSWAPLVSIIGIILYMAGKKASKKDLGQILLGFGIHRPVQKLLQPDSGCSGRRCRHRHHPELGSFHRYSSGADLHRSNHLLLGNPDHPRPEHRYLYHPNHGLLRRLQKCEALGLCSPEL